MDLSAMSAVELAAGLEAGSFRSVDIVRALHVRADEVDPLVRGWVRQDRDAAIAQAEAADAARAEGAPLGPLHGIPVSIKENFAVRGTDATMGVLTRRGQPAAEDAPVVAALRDAGAIPMGKSNVPQILLSMETHNDIWGTTHNPWKLDRVPGGSSGGEGALIASGQVPIGIGTDIGGSIRIPAAWCGICGLKPTWGRWSMVGVAGGQPGQEAIHAQAGPMARRVEDLSLMMESLSPKRQRDADPRVPPLLLGKTQRKSLRGLRVGMYLSDGIFEPAVSVQRAVRLAAEALEAAGAEVVPFSPTGSWEMFDTYFGLLSADGFGTALGILDGTPITPQLRTVARIARLPRAVRLGLARTLSLVGEGRVARLMQQLGEKSVTELWRLVARREALKQAELDAWREAGIQLLVGPPTVTPAAHLGKTHDWSIGAWHTMRYNLLDLPAGVVPVSRVQAEEQQRAVLGDRLDRRAAAFEAHSEGLPVCAQVVGLPWDEARVLAAMQAIQDARGGQPDFPVTPVAPSPVDLRRDG